MLDHHEVVRFLIGDEELRVLALGVQGVRADYAFGQVQWLQQRPEPGDLIRLPVHVSLGRVPSWPAGR